MASFNAKQLTSSGINGGSKYNNGDALTAATINDLVEGVLYATNNSGVQNAQNTANSALTNAAQAQATAKSAQTTAEIAGSQVQTAISTANKAQDAVEGVRDLANESQEIATQARRDLVTLEQNTNERIENINEAMSDLDSIIRSKVSKLGDTMRGDLTIERQDALLYSNIGYSYFEIVDDEKNYSTSYENGRIRFTDNLTKEQSTFNLPNSSGTLALESDVPRRAQIFIDCNNDRSERTVHAELVINTVLSGFEAKDIVDGESLFQFFRNCGWTSELNGIDAHGFVDDTNLDGAHNAGGILWLSVYSINFHDVYNNSDYDFDEQMVKGVAVKFN